MKKEQWKATCAECGKDCTVPFKPDDTRPVLCSACFKASFKEAPPLKLPARLDYGELPVIPPNDVEIPDIAPGLLGNQDLKEILFYSLAVLDVNNIKDTLVPLIAVGSSGSGKTHFLNCLEAFFGSHDYATGGGGLMSIWPIDSVTPAAHAGVTRGKIVQRMKFSTLAGFDEINKWSIQYVEGVLLPVFGGEHGKRARAGSVVFDASTQKTLPIGTLLPQWREFEGEGAGAARRTHTIEQLLRRTVMLQMEESLFDETASRAFLRYVWSKHFSNIPAPDPVDYPRLQKIFKYVIERAADIVDVSFVEDDFEPALANLNEARSGLFISENVNYSEEWVTLVLRLAKGRALSDGRDECSCLDVKRVADILVKHAKLAGLWSEKRFLSARARREERKATSLSA